MILGEGEKCLRFEDSKRAQQAAKKQISSRLRQSFRSNDDDYAWKSYTILGDEEKCLRFSDLKRAQQAAKVTHDGGVVGSDHVGTRSALLGLIKQQYRDTFIDKLAQTSAVFPLNDDDYVGKEPVCATNKLGVIQNSQEFPFGEVAVFR
ncbi:hypothetical protein CEXT_383281 [Caerostris extrusa]|uniref:Uncharacterized protein n=1 Tax=Caerostris extrusa TaxID=172846 RepID=A0AAV4V859_CAEEX|nr:hypothetical protein CEXT_383281 [Caerostris extrusa]